MAMRNPTKYLREESWERTSGTPKMGQFGTSLSTWDKWDKWDKEKEVFKS